MAPIDQAKHRARAIVSKRFERYVASLMGEFTTTSAELWGRVESRSEADDPESSHRAIVSAPGP